MRDILLYAALIVAVVGVFVLAYAGDRITPPLSRVSDVTFARVGENVRVAGNVTRAHTFAGGSVILTVSDGTGDVDVYLPYNVAAEYDNKNLTAVEVTGGVKVYKGRREVVVEDASNLVVLP